MDIFTKAEKELKTYNDALDEASTAKLDLDETRKRFHRVMGGKFDLGWMNPFPRGWGDGFPFVRVILSVAGLFAIPVILITGSIFSTVVIIGGALGMIGVFSAVAVILLRLVFKPQSG